MKLHEIKSVLQSRPLALPRLTLPGGDRIPEHFHVTEVGHVAKRFIDCGGKLHDRNDTCLLQTWVSDDDREHRLTAGRFAKILELGAQVLPHDDLEVEVEYDCCVVAQYPIASANVSDDVIEFSLGEKHTDCLAREKCGGSCQTSDQRATECC